MLAIETFWGPLELRQPRGQGERTAVMYDVHESYLGARVREAFQASPLQARRLASAVAWHLSPPDADPMNVLLSALRAGLLIVAKPGNAAGFESQSAEARAFRALRARFGPVFHLGMRRHRLVPRDQVDAVRMADDYDVVPAAEAAPVLLRMAESTADPQLVAHAKALAPALRDLRSSPDPEGYLLLRAASKLAVATRESVEVVTPAQLRKLAAKNWLEVLVYGRNGKPMPDVTLEVTLPNGGVERLVTASAGKVRMDALFETGPGQIAIVQIGKWVIRKDG